MPIEFESPEGSSPLEPDELEQLIPAHITTMAQLNELEQSNIAAANLWAFARNRPDVLTERFAKSLHKKMFGDVWRWAGAFRTRAVNIGNVAFYEIGTRLHQHFDDARHWIDDGVFEPDEIAARLHHELTVIHPFPNGNGRHARLMADILLKNMSQSPFTWGSGADLIQPGDVRNRYLAALRKADNYDFQPLIKFARS